MILRKLVIKNFRCYADRTEFNFAPPDKTNGRNIYLIGGRNAAGKTSILGAIHLCLYGRFESIHGEIKVQQPGDMIEYVNGAYEFRGNRQDLSEYINKKGNREILLAITYDDEGSEITVERLWSPKRTRRGSGSKVLSFDEQVTIYENGTKLADWSSQDITDLIELSIPRETAKFFFFDGEKVEHFADPDRTSEHLKLALERLLGIQTYVNLCDHLSKYVITQIRSESVEKLGGAIMSARGKIKTLEGEKQDLESEVEETKAELAKAGQDVQRVDEELRDLFRGKGNVESQRSDQKKRKRREQLASQLKQTDERRKAYLANSFPYALIYKELKTLLDQSEQLGKEAAAALTRDHLERLSGRLDEAHRTNGICPLCHNRSSSPGADLLHRRLLEHLDEIPPMRPPRTRPDSNVRFPLVPSVQLPISYGLSIRITTITQAL